MIWPYLTTVICVALVSEVMPSPSNGSTQAPTSETNQEDKTDDETTPRSTSGEKADVVVEKKVSIDEELADIMSWKDNPDRTPDSENKFLPTWPSLESRTLPEWYDRDKFGIFVHFGIYSVIGFGDWFWLNWMDPTREDYVAKKIMESNYKPKITYQDVAREFTAELFNPDEWARIFKESGARYVVLTTKHHEGYTLWPSKYSFSWNSVDVGPHRDLVGELAASIRKHTDLRFGVYYSLLEWFNKIYTDDMDNKFKTRRFVETKTIPELVDLVKTYHPDIIWTDGGWDAEDDYWLAKPFLAWLYNKSPVKDTVVVNDRWGSNTLGVFGDFLTPADRYNPKKKQSRKWENAMTIDRTWGYRKNANIGDFKTSAELIQILIETVSCGGNLLLNVGPNSLGKITPIDQERLLDIGEWLKVNGEAIYATHMWDECQNDSLMENVWYTEGTSLHALFYEWPQDGKLVLGCIKELKESAKIEFLELKEDLKWKRENAGDRVEITLPNKAHVKMEWAWVLKITGYKA